MTKSIVLLASVLLLTVCSEEKPESYEANKAMTETIRQKEETESQMAYQLQLRQQREEGLAVAKSAAKSLKLSPTPEFCRGYSLLVFGSNVDLSQHQFVLQFRGQTACTNPVLTTFECPLSPVKQ